MAIADCVYVLAGKDGLKDSHILRDEFGNRINLLFTDRTKAKEFAATSGGKEWRDWRYPIRIVVEEVIADSAAFYAIDPTSAEVFRALQGAEVLIEIIRRAHQEGLDGVTIPKGP